MPIVTLAVVGDDDVRSMFDGRYVVDDFSLILKALFLLVGYVIVLLSQTELEEGGYYQGEYYLLLLCSVLGMVMMSSSRDLVSVFVALELLSIPAYMMAAWRKRDRKSNEAGVKYYLLGVFASGVLLYGMSYLYGTTGTTKLSEIGAAIDGDDLLSMQVIAVVFVIVGFGFKVSAVPFHTWAPDTYEGAPTPVTAFLSVASKAAGFVALVTMLFVALYPADDVYQPFIWVLAALTMTVGNVLALRQTNIVRHAGLLVGEPGRLHPHAAGRDGHRRRRRVGAQVGRDLPVDLRLLEPRCVRRRDRRQPQDAQRRDQLVRRADELRPGPGSADDDLPRLAGGCAAARDLDRQAAVVQDVARRRRHDAAIALGDRGRVNTVIAAAYYVQGDARDVDEADPRRRRLPDRRPATGVAGARHLRRRHDRARPRCPSLVLRFADLPDLTSAFGG